MCVCVFFRLISSWFGCLFVLLICTFFKFQFEMIQNVGKRQKKYTHTRPTVRLHHFTKKPRHQLCVKVLLNGQKYMFCDDYNRFVIVLSNNIHSIEHTHSIIKPNLNVPHTDTVHKHTAHNREMKDLFGVGMCVTQQRQSKNNSEQQKHCTIAQFFVCVSFLNDVRRFLSFSISIVFSLFHRNYQFGRESFKP